ncbi:hypothetical protein CSA37_03725 [Candidatus Fermentibacteria bacterium]|nr:MAG: hypothetical protein CSA37_03725 [Candidatus Fermentibacteria bacterium]
MWLKNERPLLWITLLLMAVLTYWPVFSSGRLPGGEMSDTVAQGYPFFSYTAERLADGELPLWNPRILCGTPFYESFSAPVFYPLRGLPLLVLGAEASIRFLFPVHFILAGLFTWLFLKATGTSRWGSWFGAVAYSSGAWANTLFYAGHGSKIICWAWLPLLLWAVARLSATGKVRYLGFGALATGMQGLSSHPQMMLYSAGAALILSFFLMEKPLLKKGFIRGPVGLSAMVLLGGAIAAVQLYPGYLFSKHTSRGNDLSLSAASSYSLPPEETLTMAFPGMFGLRHGFTDSMVNGIPVYYGRLGLRLSSEFTGVACFLLGLLGMIKGRNRKARIALGVMGISGAVVSWGGYTPVFGVLYRILPIFRKLRAPHMAAFLTSTSIALAAGPGFEVLFETGCMNTFKKKLRIALMILSGVFLLLTAVAGPVSDSLQSRWWAENGVTDTAPYSSVVSARADLLTQDFLRFAAVTAVMAFLLFLYEKKKGAAMIFAVALTLLTAIELVPFNRSFQVYLRNTSIESLFPDTPVLREMAEGGRVFPGGNQFIPLGLKSVTGYHAAGTVETDGLLAMMSSSSSWAVRQTAASLFVTSGGAAKWEDILPALSEGIQGFPNNPMPRVFIPRSVIQGTQQDGFQMMESVNPQIRSAVENTPLTCDGVSGTAEITVDEPELVSISADLQQQGILVLADTWYPRWKAFVDGEETELHRANGWMRAVRVPQGSHTIEFRYNSSHIKTGAIASSAGLLAALVLSFARKRKKNHAKA